MPESAFTTDSIRFSTSGLMLRKNEPACQLWLNAFNDVIEFRAFDLPPDIPVRLSDARGLRTFYETAAVAQQGSLVKLEVRSVQKCRAVLLELQLPAQPQGSTFVASITLPFRDGSFVIKAQAIEMLGVNQADLNNPPSGHALSRVRASLAQIESGLVFDAALEDLAGFQDDKPWWKFWN
jgi:hypothetical protein